MNDLPQSFREQVQGLLKQHAIRIVPNDESFELSSGQKSRVYCDVKKVSQSREGAQMLAWMLRIKAEQDFGPIDAFAGVALGGSHLASIASLVPLPEQSPHYLHTIHVRKDPKGHGTRNLIEAPAMDKTTARIVLLEDVTTTAGSAVKALEALKAAGYNVLGVLTVVDRREAWNFTDVDDVVGSNSWPIFSLYRLESLVDKNPDESLL